MTIKELKQIVDEAYTKGKECDVEFYLVLNAKEQYMVDIDYIGQFNAIPDVIISFKLIDDGIDLTGRKLNAKTVNYKKEYKSLKSKLDKIEKILYEED